MRFPFGPIGVFGSRIPRWVEEFVENGGRLAGRGWSVAVDVDPNVLKPHFFQFDREVAPGAPSLQKPHIKVGSLSKLTPLNRQLAWGGFGVEIGPTWSRVCDQRAASGPQSLRDPLKAAF